MNIFLVAGSIFMMTNEEYVKTHAGSLCPFCGSSDITASDPDFDGAQIFENVKCEDCGKEWQDKYELVAFEPLKAEESE